MSNFSNLEKRLQEKDQLLDSKETLLDEKDLQISLLHSKVQELEHRWKPHSEFLLSNMEENDLLTYDELYMKFVELHTEKGELSDFKEVSIQALMEKDSHITELTKKLSEIEVKSQLIEATQLEVLKDRDITRDRLSSLSEVIKKEEIVQNEKKKNIEAEINKEVQSKLDDYLKKSKDRENELHNALLKYGEEIDGLKNQLESQEKRFQLKEKSYKKELENINKKVDDLEIKKAVDPDEVLKMNNKYTKDIEILNKIIFENREAHEKEIQIIENEKIRFIKKVELKESDNKKIEEIKQSLQIQIEALQKELSVKENYIEQMRQNFQNQLIEMKEKQELEMNALDIQYKKLKQDDDIYRRKSSLIMKPLINELTAMAANSNKFNFFDKITQEIGEESEMDSDQEEIERLGDELHEAINQITEIKEENKLLKQSADEIRLEKLELIEKHQENLGNIEILKAKVEELEGFKQVISLENEDLKGILEKLQPEVQGFKEIVENLKKEMAFREALHQEALRALKENKEMRKFRKQSEEFIEITETLEKVEGILEKTEEIAISQEKIDAYFIDLQEENTNLKKKIAIYEGNLLDLAQELKNLREKAPSIASELKEIEEKLEEISIPLELNDEINKKITKLYTERGHYKKEAKEGVIHIEELNKKEKSLIIEIEELKAFVKDAQGGNNELLEKNQGLKEEIKGILKENEEIKADFQEKFGEITRNFEEEIEVFRKKIVGLESEIEELRKENLQLKEKINKGFQEKMSEKDFFEEQSQNLLRVKEFLELKMQEIEQLKEELELKKQENEIQKEVIEELKEEIEEKTKEIEENKKEIEEKNTEIEENFIELETHKEEIEALKEENKAQNEEIQGFIIENKAQKEEILKNKEEILKKIEEIKENKKEIDDIKLKIEGQIEEIKGFKDEIKGFIDEIQKKKEEIEGKNKEIEGKKEEIQEKINEISLYKEEISLQKEEIDWKTFEIDQIKAEIVDKNVEITLKSQEINELKLEIQEKNKEILFKNEEIELSKQEVAEKTQEILLQKEEIQQSKAGDQAKNEEIHQQKEEFLLIKEEILQKNEEISKKTQEIEKKTEELLKKTQEIQQSKSEIEVKSIEIEVMKEEIEKFKQEIAIRNHDIQAKQQEIESQKLEKESFISENVTLKEEKEFLQNEGKTLKKENSDLEKQKENLSNVKNSLENQINSLENQIQSLIIKNTDLDALNTKFLSEIQFLQALLKETREILEYRKKNMQKNDISYGDLLKKSRISEPEQRVLKVELLNEHYLTTFDSISHLISQKIDEFPNKNCSSIQQLQQKNLVLKEILDFQHENLQTLIKNPENSSEFIIKALKSIDSSLISEENLEKNRFSKWEILAELRDKIAENECVKSQFTEEKSVLNQQISNLENALAYKDSLTKQVLRRISAILPEDELFLLEEALGTSEKLLQKSLEGHSQGYLLEKWQEILEENQKFKEGICLYELKSQDLVEALKGYSEKFLNNSSENEEQKRFFGEIIKEAEKMPEDLKNLSENDGFLKKMREMQQEIHCLKDNEVKMKGEIEKLDVNYSELQATNEEITYLTENMHTNLANIGEELHNSQLQNKESLVELSSLKKLMFFYEKKLKEILGDIPEFTQNELIYQQESPSASPSSKKMKNMQNKQASFGIVMNEQVEKLDKLKEKAWGFSMKKPKSFGVLKDLQYENEALRVENEKFNSFKKIVGEKVDEFLKISDKNEIILDLKRIIEKNELFSDKNPEILRENYLLKVESFANNRLKEETLQTLEELEVGLLKENNIKSSVLSLLSAAKQALNNPLSVSESDLETNFLKLQDKLQKIELDSQNLMMKISPIFSELFNLNLPIDVHLQNSIDLKRILNIFFKKDEENGIEIIGELKDLVSRNSLREAQEKLMKFEEKMKKSNERIADLELQIEAAIQALLEEDPKLKEESLRKLQKDLKTANEELILMKDIIEGTKNSMVSKESLEKAEKKLRVFEGKIKSSEEKIKELENQIKEAIEALLNSELEPKLKEEALKKLENASKMIIEKLKEELKGVKQEMERFLEEIEEKNEEIKGKNEEIQMKCEEIREIKGEIKVKNGEIKVLNEGNKRFIDEIQKNIEEIKGKDEEIDVLKEDNQRFKDEIQKNIKEIKGKDEEIEVLKEGNKRFIDEIQKNIEEIKGKDEEIKVLNEGNNRFNDEIHKKIEEIKGKDEEIEVLKEGNKRFNDEIHKKIEEIKGKDEEIEVLKEEANKKFTDEINKKIEEIKGKDDEIEVLKEGNKRFTDKIHKKIEVLKENIQIKNEEIKGKDEEIEVLKENNQRFIAKIEEENNKEIQAKEMKINILIKEIESKNEEVKGKNEEIEVIKNNLKNLCALFEVEKEEVIQKDGEIRQKEKEILNKDSEITESNKKINEKINDIQMKNSEIKRKNEEIQQMIDEIAQKNEEIQVLQTILHKKDEETKNLDKKLKEKSDEIIDKIHDLHEKTQENKVLRDVILVEKSQEIDVLKQEIQEKKNLLKEIREKEQENNKEITVLKDEIKEIKEKYKEKDDFIDKIKEGFKEKEENFEKNFREKEEFINEKREELKRIIEELKKESLIKSQEIKEKTEESSLKTQEIVKFERKLVEKELFIEELTRKYQLNSSEISLNLDNLRKELESKNEFLANLKENLIEKEVIIKDFIDKLKLVNMEKAHDLEILRSDLFEKAHLIEEIKRILLEKEGILKELNIRIECLSVEKEKEVKDLKKEIVGKGSFIEEIKGVLLKKEEDLKEKDKDIIRIKEVLEEKEKEITKIKEILEGKIKEIKENFDLKENIKLERNGFKEKIDELEGLLQRKTEEIFEKSEVFSTKIQLKNEEISKKEAITRDFSEKIKKLEEEIVKNTNKIKEKDEEIVIISFKLLEKNKENEDLKQNILQKEANLRDFSEKNSEFLSLLQIKTSEISSKNQEILENLNEISNQKQLILQKESQIHDISEKFKALEAKYLTKDQAFFLLDSQMKHCLETLLNKNCEKDATDKALRSLKEAYENLNLLLEENGVNSEESRVLQAKILQINQAFNEYLTLYESFLSTKKQRNKALYYIAFLLPEIKDKKTRIIERKRTSGRFFEGFGPKKKTRKLIKRGISDDFSQRNLNLEKSIEITHNSKEFTEKNEGISEKIAIKESEKIRNLLKNYKEIRVEIEKKQKRNNKALEILDSEETTQAQQLQALSQIKCDNSPENINKNLILNEILFANFLKNYDDIQKTLISQRNIANSHSLIQKKLKKAYKSLQKINEFSQKKIKEFEENFTNLAFNLENTLNSLNSSETSSKEREFLLNSLQKELLKMKTLASELSVSKKDLSALLKNLEEHKATEKLSEKEKALLQAQLSKYLQIIEEIQNQYNFTKKDLDLAHLRIQEILAVLQQKNLTEEEKERALRSLQDCDEELVQTRRRLNEMDGQKKKTMKGLEDLQIELMKVMNKEKDYQELLKEKDVECEFLKKICEELKLEKQRFNQEIEFLKNLEKKNQGKNFGVFEEMIRKIQENQEKFFEKFVKEKTFSRKNNDEEFELQAKLKDFRRRIVMNEASLGIFQKELEKLLEELSGKDMNNENIVKKLKDKLSGYIKGFIDLQIENKLIKGALQETNTQLEKFKTGVVRDFEDFIIKKEEDLKKETQEIQKNLLETLGEFSIIFAEFENSQRNKPLLQEFDNNRPFFKEINDNKLLKEKDLETLNLRTESTTFTKNLNHNKKKSNNFRTLTCESETFAPLSTNPNVLYEEDFLIESEFSNQFNVIKEAYEVLKQRYSEEIMKGKDLKQEIRKYEGNYQEILKKIKQFSKKLKELSIMKDSQMQIKRSSYLKKSLNFTPNMKEIDELASWRIDLKTHILEIIDNVSLLENDLGKSLQIGSILKKPKPLNEIFIERFDPKNEKNMKIEKENMKIEKKTMKFDLKSMVFDTNDENLHKFDKNEDKFEIFPLNSDYFEQGKLKENPLKSDYFHRRYKTIGVEKLRELREKAQTTKNSLQRGPISFDFGESKLNRTSDSETGFLQQENTRLSVEITDLEKNYKENSLWAKTLNENIKELKENLIKHQNFEDSLIQILNSPKEPDFFDIFADFSTEQRNIIYKIKAYKCEVDIKEDFLKEMPKISQSAKKFSNKEFFYSENPLKNSKKIYTIDQSIQKTDEDLEDLRKANKELKRLLTIKEKEIQNFQMNLLIEKQKCDKKIKEIESKTGNFSQKIQKNLIKGPKPSVFPKELVRNQQEQIETREIEVKRWKDRYLHLERKYQQFFNHISEKNTINQQENAIFIQSREEIDELKKKLELQENNMRINKMKTIEERANMQKIIKGLKEEIIEKNTNGVLKEIEREFEGFQHSLDEKHLYLK